MCENEEWTSAGRAEVYFLYPFWEKAIINQDIIRKQISDNIKICNALRIGNSLISFHKRKENNMKNSKMKLTKRIMALLIAVMMVVAMCVPAFASETTDKNTFTLPVSIQTQVMNGKVIRAADVTLNEGDTALDALKKLYPAETETKETISGVEYHYLGDLKWYQTSYTFDGVTYTSNYIPAIKMPGHSQNNRFFGDNGTISSDPIALKGKYKYLPKLNATETKLGLAKNSTFNNQIHATDWLSEKDYNNYSGWMLLINGNTNNNGVDTVLIKDSGSVCLAFSMMTGLDLGQTGYIKNSEGEWTQVNPW